MSRFARLTISVCALCITFVFTRPYLSPRRALVGLGRPSIVKETWFFFLPSCCLQKKTSGEKGGKGSGTAFCNGGCSISLLIPFSVFLIFGIFLHSEGIFLGILFIRERRAFLFLSLSHARARLPRCLVF